MVELFSRTQIRINCLTPKQSLKSVMVDCRQTVHILDPLYSQDMAFFFKGQLLQKKYRFLFYGINDGSCLIAVPNRDPEKFNIWKKLSNLSNSSFLSRFQGSAAICIEKERVRLADLNLSKLDLRPRRLKEFIVNFNSKVKNLEQENVDQKQCELTYEKPSTYCSDPLPTFWTHEKSNQ